MDKIDDGKTEAPVATQPQTAKSPAEDEVSLVQQQVAEATTTATTTGQEQSPEDIALNSQGLKLLKSGDVKAFNALRRDNFEWDPDLKGADLSVASLIEVALYRADLSESILHGTVLTRANLRGANLTGADLADVILFGAYLIDANLTDVLNLDPDMLSEAAFKRATVDPELADRAAALLRRSIRAPHES